MLLSQSERATALRELEHNQALRDGLMGAFREAGENETGSANYWLDRIAQQVPNRAVGDGGTSQRLLMQLADLELERAQPARARILYERLLSEHKAALPTEVEAGARCGLAQALRSLSEVESGLREHALIPSLAETLRGAARLTLVRCLRTILIRDDEASETAALVALKRAAQELDQLDDTYLVRVTQAALANDLGMALESAGRFEEATLRYREAVSLDRTLGRGETLGTATTLAAIASSEMARGELQAADRDFTEALALSERVAGLTSLLAIDIANHAVLKGFLDQHAGA